MYVIHAGRTRPKLPAEVDWWDRTRAEYITITITMYNVLVVKSAFSRDYYFRAVYFAARNDERRSRCHADEGDLYVALCGQVRSASIRKA